MNPLALVPIAALLILARKPQRATAFNVAHIQADAERLRRGGDGRAADAIERSLAVLRSGATELVGMAIAVDEQPGGDHYGGDDPFDYEHQIFCMVCRREGTAYVRDANYETRVVEWLRFETGWTAQLPVNAGDREGFRCPDHQFPRPRNGPVPPLGPPVPPHRLVRPGWYWYWVRPGDETIAWRVMLRRWGRPIYVLKSHKSWEDIFLGSIELFEVNGQDMVWTMPSPLSRPKPAPSRENTTLLEILAAGIELG